MEDKIYKYSKLIRNCNETVKDFFNKIFVIDYEGKQNIVPVIWATPERALASAIQKNVESDSDLIVDRIRLPLINLFNVHFEPNLEKVVETKDGKVCPVRIHYELNINCLYQDDLDQIIEQIFLKFNPNAYLKMNDDWNYKLSMKYLANNFLDTNENNTLKIIKFKIAFIAETHYKDSY